MYDPLDYYEQSLEYIKKEQMAQEKGFESYADYLCAMDDYYGNMLYDSMNEG